MTSENAGSNAPAPAPAPATGAEGTRLTALTDVEGAGPDVEVLGLGDWSPAVLGDVGRLRRVLTAPAAPLGRAGVEVDPTADEVVRLAADLVATMRASPGCVGLAAPQIGVGARVFAVDVTGHPKAVTVHGTFVLCNATIVEASRWRPGREGCMSVPDLTGDVKRASRLVVTGQLPGTGQPVRLVADGFEARALQHEIDHCAGLLFLDRVAGAHAVYQRKVYL